jgi:hypothetical protein
MTRGNSHTSTEINLNQPRWVFGVKYRPAIEKDIFMNFDPLSDPQGFVKIKISVDVGDSPESQAFQRGAIRPLSIFDHVDL